MMCWCLDTPQLSTLRKQLIWTGSKPIFCSCFEKIIEQMNAEFLSGSTGSIIAQYKRFADSEGAGFHWVYILTFCGFVFYLLGTGKIDFFGIRRQPDWQCGPERQRHEYTDINQVDRIDVLRWSFAE